MGPVWVFCFFVFILTHHSGPCLLRLFSIKNSRKVKTSLSLKKIFVVAVIEEYCNRTTRPIMRASGSGSDATGARSRAAAADAVTLTALRDGG